MATRKSKKPTKRTRSSRKRGTSSRKRKSPASRSAGSASTGLSLDRKLDILGIALSLVGLLTLLSLLSSSRGALTGAWLTILGRSLGWGSYLLPLALIALGLWLILRHFERVPQVDLERVLGLTLLYLNLLVWLHFSLFPPDRADVFAQAEVGRGGGYVGGAILEISLIALGWWGTAVALMAWLLIALALSLDVSIAELFRWVPPLFLRVQDWWDERRAAARRTAETMAGVPGPGDSLPAARTSGPTPYPVSPSTMAPISPPEETTPKEWTLPPINEILDKGGELTYNDEYDRQRARVIEDTLASFGAPAHVVEINRGPTITQFGVEPDFVESSRGRTRVRVGKIASLADDLALALAASRIRVEAPAPGKGYVGIEVPNEEIALVALRDVIESEAFRRLKSPLRFALGQDVAGNAVAADLTGMPHLLVAGATGSGKSVCVNAIISCLLAHNTPAQLRMIMVDPKRVELTGYNGIPHLLAPVVVELERVVGALQWVTREMDQRYHKLAQSGARHIHDYNARQESQGAPILPYLVVVVDELADLMMLAPDETERTLTRLAQLARATGIHLVISTQRPSTDVVTGLIKANFPARIAFAVASGVDSRVIIDQPGAERLLGRGDMLFQAPDAPAPVRLQGVFVSEAEIQRLVQYWRGFITSAESAPPAADGIPDALPPGIPLKQLKIWEEMEPEEEQDPLLDEAIDLVRRKGRASISMLQRRLRIGYTRAARLVETMEAKEIVSPPQPGNQSREVLDYGPAAPPADEG
jgi:S-DNA-T family DNA segregation ATPase FtsK/SpoIIIE